MENNKNVFKNWKLYGIVVVAILIVVGITIFALRSNLTPEETISKFMHLIENKEYEKAKKLCSGKLEYLDSLSNIKPSNLRFEYSEDKKNATSVLLEDKETAEMTTMYVELNNSLLGWKIKSYTVNTDLIPQSILQARLEDDEDISESEFLLWALYEETSTEDISKYAEDNLIILTLFSQMMKEKQYERAMKLYKPIGNEIYNGRELSEEEIKEFDWANCNIYNSTELLGINTYMINNYDKKVNVMINIDHTISHIYKPNI